MRFVNNILAVAAICGLSSASVISQQDAAIEPADYPPATPPPASTYTFYNVTPTQINFESSGTPIVGFHYAPQNQSKDAPVVLVTQGLGGLQTSRIMPFAAKFATQGYHAITFDYRYWGFSSGHPRNIIHIPDQAADYKAAADYMRTVPGVDPNRIVLWGTSLSGGNVLQIAGQGTIPGVVATIAQCPYVDGLYTISLLPPESLLPLTTVGILDDVNAGTEALGLPIQPIYIPLANYTGEEGALTQTGALEGYEFVQPNPPPPGNVFPARFVTELPFFSPQLTAPNSTVPTFIGVGLTDNIVGHVPQEQLATTMQAELRQYDGGHFSVYYGATNYEAILADQVAFLQKNVPL